MNSDEKKELLGRMRTAIKQGKENRREDLMDMREEANELRYWSAVSRDPEDTKDFIRHLDKAKDRNMLKKKNTAALGDLKQREPYEKRPSVRARKKHKSKSAGLSI